MEESSHGVEGEDVVVVVKTTATARPRWPRLRRALDPAAATTATAAAWPLPLSASTRSAPAGHGASPRPPVPLSQLYRAKNPDLNRELTHLSMEEQLAKVTGRAARACPMLLLIWDEFAGESLLQIQLLTSLRTFVSSLGFQSPLSYHMLIPILQSGINIDNPDTLNLLEDSVRLWEATLPNAPSIVPQLLDLFPYLVGIVNRSFDHPEITVKIIEDYTFFGGPEFLKSHGASLANIVDTIVGNVNDKGLLTTLPIVDLLIQIMDLPFSLYSTFVIEARHGFNKQTIWLFIRDMVKGILLSMLLGPPIVAAIIFIVQNGGPYLALYLWGFMFALALVMMTIYPVLIAPLFNKFTPLPDGVLRDKIEKLAASLKFPLKKLFVVDGSTRSSHSNAYMYGFFKNKRIVLYDTLVQQCSNEDEIVSVISHELGHWKLNHTVYSFVAVQLLMFLQFGGYTLVRNSKDLFESFGFEDQPVIIGLIIFQHTIIPLQHFLSFCLNLVSRAFEFQADAFAKNLGYAPQLRAALVKLQEENLSAMNTDPWYSAYHYSHPPLVERLQALEDLGSKKED